ncbi:hypothetical protein niasHT_026631 [Heterodera trifolii]|uniref:Serpentine Receptor, class T n=1 Tax=Heterodera trifolii TaxID=157864 RepID=A0ABD2KSD9_9BILA
MDKLFWNAADFDHFYNCSSYKIETVPIENRQKTFFGILMLLSFFAAEALYVPCLVVMWRHLKENCYKIMFSIGLVDFVALWVCAFETGLFSIMGSVFCSYPILIYISGMFGNVVWAFETTMATILALNRCFVVVASSKAEEFLFGGWRIWAWVGGALLYSCWFGFFNIPIVFNSQFFVWSYNSHLGYSDENAEMYVNQWETVHDMAILFALVISYGFFMAYLLVKNLSFKLDIVTSANKNIFLQVLLISTVNIVTSLCYVLMGFVELPQWAYFVTTFMWMFCHGFPPIIYLTMNKTIRKECAKMFPSRIWAKKTSNLVNVQANVVILATQR